MKQTSFLPHLRLEHGGSLRSGKRKIARPFSHKHLIHVVLRSHRARGRWSMLTMTNKRLVERTLERCAFIHHVRIKNFVNVGNHLHLLIQTKSRTYAPAKRNFQAFMRRFAGEVALKITGATKGCSQGGFWGELAYTRIVEWGRPVTILKNYFAKNFFESVGLWSGNWNTDDWETCADPPG